MNPASTLTISEAALKQRPDHYLQKVELEGLTLLIERNGIIAAKIQPPDTTGVMMSKASPNWMAHVGALQSSGTLDGDPVAIQRKMRSEWQRKPK
jgi:hypothetical protein